MQPETNNVNDESAEHLPPPLSSAALAIASSPHKQPPQLPAHSSASASNVMNADKKHQIALHSNERKVAKGQQHNQLVDGDVVITYSSLKPPKSSPIPTTSSSVNSVVDKSNDVYADSKQFFAAESFAVGGGEDESEWYVCESKIFYAEIEHENLILLILRF